MAFFIKAPDGTQYEMDATTDVRYRTSGKPSKYAVMEGSKSSDHYSQEQDTISMNGIVSKVKFSTNPSIDFPLEEFVKGMVELKKSGQRFICSFSDSLEPLPNCMFTTLAINRSATTGESLSISYNLVQVTVANQTEVEVVPEPAPDFKSDAADENKTVSSPTFTPLQLGLIGLKTSLGVAGLLF